MKKETDGSEGSNKGVSNRQCKRMTTNLQPFKAMQVLTPYIGIHWSEAQIAMTTRFEQPGDRTFDDQTFDDQTFDYQTFDDARGFGIDHLTYVLGTISARH